VNWVTPVRDWVQPDKDLKVILSLIDRNLMTYSEAAKARGKDFEEILIQREKEEEMIKKHNLQEEECDATTTEA